jgi:DNA repair protein RecO (recombination protein O)
MQKIIETLGIILKTLKVNETDKRIVMLTRDHGKINALAHGAYKNINKWRTGFEPFSIINFHLHERNKYLTIVAAEENKNFKDIHASYQKMMKASFLVGLIDCFSYENNKDEQIFALLITSLEKLNDAPDKARENRTFFEFESLLLTVLGYSPSAIFCNDCARKLSEAEPVYLDSLRDVFLCPECNAIAKADIKISPLTKKLILNPITTEAPNKNVRMGISVLTKLLEKASSETDSSSKFLPVKKEIWDYFNREDTF